MTEDWKDVAGYEGAYQVSSNGRIRSLLGSRPRIMTPFTAHTTGYLQIDLRKTRHSVHRLVAIAWCGGHFDGAHVDHVNGIRDDNRAENLEWVTPSENVRRGYKNGRISPTLGKFSGEHNASKPVIATCIETGEETYFASAMDAVRQGFDSSAISRCCHGQNRFHNGHYWRFGDQQGVEWSDPQATDTQSQSDSTPGQEIGKRSPTAYPVAGSGNQQGNDA